MTQYDLYSKPLNMNKTYVKSPFNYIGGKYKILPHMLSLFPSYIGVFVDVFGGGGNVTVNVGSDEVTYNDNITPLVELMKYLYTHKISSTINYIEHTIKDYNLSKEDKDTFNEFRAKYNNTSNPNPLDLYILLSFSFNHQLRFNNNLEYNSSHGTNRSSFNKNMKQNLIRFMEKLHSKDMIFLNEDFRKINYLDYNSRVSFFYFDPPYYITSSPYHDGKRGFGDWTIREEYDLYELLDTLDSVGYKWGCSNTLVHDGKRNNILSDWLDDSEYNVHLMDTDYSNSNYQKIVEEYNSNVEVYVTNVTEDKIGFTNYG